SWTRSGTSALAPPRRLDRKRRSWRPCACSMAVMKLRLFWVVIGIEAAKDWPIIVERCEGGKCNRSGQGGWLVPDQAPIARSVSSRISAGQHGGEPTRVHSRMAALSQPSLEKAALFALR